MMDHTKHPAALVVGGKVHMIKVASLSDLVTLRELGVK